MIDFNEQIFVSKLNSYGIKRIEPYAQKAYSLPMLFEELPELTVTCVLDGNSEMVVVAAAIDISGNADIKALSYLREILKEHIPIDIQDTRYVANALFNMTEFDYKNVYEASEIAACAIYYFIQQFERYALKTFQYASTGNTNYIN